MSTHRHHYQVSQWQGGKPPKVGFRCQKEGCGDSFVRAMDAEEQERFKKKTMFPQAPEDNVHHVWHELVKRLPAEWQSVTGQTEKAAIVDIIEKFQDEYPDQVYVTGVDDDYFMSSDLVLVTHDLDDAFMGTTVIYIPQREGVPSAQFFLYPGHAEGLMLHLREIKARYAKRTVTWFKGWRQSIREREDRKWWNSRPLRKKEAIK